MAKRQKRFKHPFNPQVSSPLAQLPPELQILILQCLLNKRTPVAKRSASVSTTTTQTGTPSLAPSAQVGDEACEIKLSPEILRSCQWLYDIGKKILYEENTLLVDCAFNANEAVGNTCVHILDSYIVLPEYATSLPRGSDLFKSAEELVKDIPPVVDASATGWIKVQQERQCNRVSAAACLIDVRKSLELFPKVKVQVDRKDVFQACRFLQVFLRSRDVVFVVGKGGPKTCSHDQGASAQAPPPSRLLSCAYLRCKSIIFEGYSPQETCEVGKVITSKTSVVDTWAQFLKFRPPYMPISIEGNRFDPKRKYIDSVRHAARTYNTIKYEHAKKRLCNEADVWNKMWARKEIEKIKAKRERIRKAIDAKRG